MEAVVIEGVSKYFGRTCAVTDLSLKVEFGEVIGFLGTNGAGKTTTIKMLLGFFEPDAGHISVLGAPPHRPATRQRIGFMPETAYYYPYLSARELLAFYGGLHGMTAREIKRRSEPLIELVGLGHAGSRTLRTYSKGMLQRIGIAQALLHNPDLLILDEPLTGLDPLARIQFRDIIAELRQQGKTIFFSSHELTEAELICDRVAIMREGALLSCGAVSVIAGDGRQNLERMFLQTLGVDVDKEKRA